MGMGHLDSDSLGHTNSKTNSPIHCIVLFVCRKLELFPFSCFFVNCLLLLSEPFDFRVRVSIFIHIPYIFRSY